MKFLKTESNLISKVTTLLYLKCSLLNKNMNNNKKRSIDHLHTTLTETVVKDALMLALIDEDVKSTVMHSERGKGN
jgi:hypothetical protein